MGAVGRNEVGRWRGREPRGVGQRRGRGGVGRHGQSAEAWTADAGSLQVRSQTTASAPLPQGPGVGSW